MAEKLDAVALAIALFALVLGLLEAESGDMKNVVLAFVPGLTNSIAKVMALTPLPFVPAGPAGPVAPVPPAGPVAPAGPCGIVKLRTAAELVPEFVTTADVPDAPVVVVPTLTVDEEPARARTAQIPPLPDTFVAGSTAVFVTSAMKLVPLSNTASPMV
jgi:hypothetical protein